MGWQQSVEGRWTPLTKLATWLHRLSEWQEGRNQNNGTKRTHENITCHILTESSDSRTNGMIHSKHDISIDKQVSRNETSVIIVSCLPIDILLQLSYTT